MKIQIHHQNFELTEPFQKYLNQKFSTLNKYQANILNFQVNINRDAKHQSGDIFSLEVLVTMPNKVTLVARENHQDARAAVDLIQENIARQLVKYKDKRVSKLRKNTKYFKSLKFWKKHED